jgi:two-component system chemotaxis response regulator CheY
MRAIVIDDSRATRMILRRILEGLSFDVLEAEDGAAALDVLSAQGPMDLALVDWNMPVMDGVSFVRALRKDARQDGCKVVMVTTESDADHIVEALEAGANEYAMKPFDREVLASKLSLLGVGSTSEMGW